MAKVRMKKIFLTVFILGSIFQVQAQIKIGLRVAPQLTWSKPDNKNTTTNGTRLNIAYGMMLDFYFTENYAIGSEFTIQTMGTNLNLSKDRYTSIKETFTNKVFNATEDVKYNYRMNFVQIPLLIKMRTKEIGNMRYYAEFGASAGFLTKVRADVKMDKFERNNININEPDDEDQFDIETSKFKDGISSFRSGIIFGAGLQYKFTGSSLLVAGLRYDNAFTNYSKDDRWNATLNYVALTVGVLF
jgi:hypothetical protein